MAIKSAKGNSWVKGEFKAWDKNIGTKGRLPSLTLLHMKKRSLIYLAFH
jgi:hypothetical protein